MPRAEQSGEHPSRDHVPSQRRPLLEEPREQLSRHLAGTLGGGGEGELGDCDADFLVGTTSDGVRFIQGRAWMHRWSAQQLANICGPWTFTPTDKNGNFKRGEEETHSQEAGCAICFDAIVLMGRAGEAPWRCGGC